MFFWFFYSIAFVEYVNSFHVFDFEILFVSWRKVVIMSIWSLKFGYFCTQFSDINECASGTHNCHANAACTNTDGSFTCACNTGYHGNGVTCTGRQKILNALLD